jgi:hypothetical protein
MDISIGGPSWENTILCLCGPSKHRLEGSFRIVAYCGHYHKLNKLVSGPLCQFPTT